MKRMTSYAVMLVSLIAASCSDRIEMRYPPRFELPDLPVVEDVQKDCKAPLYWSVYEYCYDREAMGDNNIDISVGEWDKIIDWVATELKPYGYDMICTDGFIPMEAKDETGYMTHYGSISLKELVAKCESKGLKLGVYDNPLWLHGDRNTRIEGTDYVFGNLVWNGTTEVMNKGAEDTWFTWVVAENPGAKEYIDNFFKYYSELGVKFIRMDFLSWYEDGKDRGMGTTGRGYGRESYGRAMSYIAESAKRYGVFTSLVMPHMYSDAQVESMYGNMTRIVCDTGGGGWWHTSAQSKGQSFTTWPNCMNQFDGFAYWSHIGGRDKIILDGDFTRLNKFAGDDEKMTAVSLQLMAGGPIAVADQYSTIGDNLRFYTNSEMLALNKDNFRGKPLSDNLIDENKKNEIWYGSMSDGSVVVGFFNRDDNVSVRSVSFAELGLTGEWNVRDLWSHEDIGKASGKLSYNIPAHGCKIVKLTR